MNTGSHIPDVTRPFEPTEAFACKLDATDPLRGYREQFHIPRGADGQPVVYFAGNSLGLQPKRAAELVKEELQFWAERGVEGHFEGPRPWYSYHELLRESGARLVGAKAGEVVMMNSLTVNLHLMMVSFYRPTPDRYKILIEAPCFPSDIYAVKTQLRYHGLDPAEALIVVGGQSPLTQPSPPGGERENNLSSSPSRRSAEAGRRQWALRSPSLPRRGQGALHSPSLLRRGQGAVDGDHLIRTDDIEAVLEREGERIALVMLGGVNFVTGQLLDIPRIAAASHAKGCIVGFDLAHAAGNVPLSLHDWEVDFAVWCNYKYLNSGPGAVGACFVHERHGRNLDLPRFGGWWGNDPATRFRMHLNPDFLPSEGAEGWQISNPPILSLAPVKASYDIFDEVGMAALREKSLRLTGYLEYLLEEATKRRSDEATEGNAEMPKRRNVETQRAADFSRRGRSDEATDPDFKGASNGGGFEIITPHDPAQRGCQLSLRFRANAREVLQRLHQVGIVCDFREPDVIRVAPVPLYNTFHDVWRFTETVAGVETD